MASYPHAFASSVGTKLLVGASGLGLFGYLIVHIAGNLMVFLGPTVFNQYSHTLLSNPLVVVIEVGLVVLFLVHVFKAVSMSVRNGRARPARYVKKEYAGAPSRKSIASSTMILSGLWLLALIVIHVKTFKFGAAGLRDGVRDLYSIEMRNFASTPIAAFYVLSMLVVGSHLWHGVSSAFQSLGVDALGWTPRIRLFGKLMAILIASSVIVIVLR